MSNRVEELEEQVAELRAAVNGLTEELVETKSRLKDLEADAAEPPAPTTAAEPTETSTVQTTKSDDHVEVVTHEQSKATGASATNEPTDPTESADSDVETTESDTHAAGESPAEPADEPDGNDIIVA